MMASASLALVDIHALWRNLGTTEIEFIVSEVGDWHS